MVMRGGDGGNCGRHYASGGDGCAYAPLRAGCGGCGGGGDDGGGYDESLYN
jgi:hypothetical protein